MTIKEALAKGIKKVRLPQWNNKAYLELPVLGGGKYGLWAELHDPFSCFALGKSDEPTYILIMQILQQDESTEWRKY